MVGFDFDDIFTEWVSVDQELDIQLLRESQNLIVSQVIVTYSFDSKQS